MLSLHSPMRLFLPCHLGNDTFGEFSDKELPCLVEQQEAHSESEGQEPILNWYYCSAKHAVELGHIQEENGDDHREDDGRQEVWVSPGCVIEE